MKRFVLAAGIALLLRGGFAAEDPRLLAAEASLADGQPDRAVALLRDLPATRQPTRERIALVRAQWALGNPRSALMTLDAGPAGDCAAWPLPVRAAAARLAGSLHAALGDLPAARRAIAVALAAGGDDPATADLALELAMLAGDRAEALRLAQAGWQRHPRTAAQAAAGIALARLLEDETAARTVLAQVRALPGVAAIHHRDASELLCRILLPRQPGQCLVVAERSLAIAPPPSPLQLYRALALAALASPEALAELEALPAPWRDDPAVAQAVQQLRAGGGQADRGQRLERARAAAELGQWQQVVALVGEEARRDPEALQVLALAVGIDLRPWAEAPAARDPAAATALARALALDGHGALAWHVVQPALAVARPGQDGEVWLWSAEAALAAAPDRADALLQQATEAQPPPAEVGIAWSRLAERAEARGLPAEDAWLRAAEALPLDHPWHWPAVARVLRSAVAAGKPDPRIETLAISAVSAPDQEDVLRCRFLLAQWWARTGRIREAADLARGLLALADESQRGRVQNFLDSLPGGEGSPRDTP